MYVKDFSNGTNSWLHTWILFVGKNVVQHVSVTFRGGEDPWKNYGAAGMLQRSELFGWLRAFWRKIAKEKSFEKLNDLPNNADLTG